MNLDVTCNDSTVIGMNVHVHGNNNIIHSTNARVWGDNNVITGYGSKVMSGVNNQIKEPRSLGTVKFTLGDKEKNGGV